MSKALNTPKCKAFYARFKTPDTKYADDGEYKVKGRFDTDLPEVQKFVEQIDAWYDESFDAAVAKAVEDGKYKTEAVARKKVKRGDKPYVYVEDDEGEDTNEIEINFRMKAKAKNKKTGETFTLKPVIFGAAGPLEVNQIPYIGNGSVIRVAYTPIQWYTQQLGASVKLRLEGAKLYEVIAGGGNSGVGFDDDDDGYVAPEGGVAFEDDDPGADDSHDDDDGSGDF